MLLGEYGASWTTVQRIRFDGFDAHEAVAAVRAFMAETGGTIGSWWLSEHSTPSDVEERLLEAGLRIIVGDYLIDGMLLTAPPPPADVVARCVATFDEFVAATELQYDVFDIPAARRRSRESLAGSCEVQRAGDVWALYAAWIDGRIAASGSAYFSPRGVLMSGGSTVPWARGRGAYRALVRARWDDAVAQRHSGAHGAGRSDVRAGPAAARLRDGVPVPSSRGRSLYGVTAVKEICLRCGAEMEWRHGHVAVSSMPLQARLLRGRDRRLSRSRLEQLDEAGLEHARASCSSCSPGSCSARSRSTRRS